VVKLGTIRGSGPRDPRFKSGRSHLCASVVTRKTRSGLVIGSEEAINTVEAVRVYTYNGAYLEKEENRKGSIESGKLADLVLLDRDLLTVPSEEIKDIKGLKTIVNGEVVFSI
jgi:predicted amidohydrolase YtcJ